MKRPYLFILLCAVFLAASTGLQARINVFEPWLPGKDTSVGPLYTYEPSAGIRFGQQLFEIPVDFTYRAAGKMEVGGRLGLISVDGQTGINDMMLGLKYKFLEQSVENPAVAGEIAVSLPTADQNRGLGTGALGLLLNWILEKDIAKVTASLDLGVRLNAENSDKVQYPNEFFYQIGAVYPYKNGLNFFGELKGFNHGKTKINGVYAGNTTYELYLAPGASYEWMPGRKALASLLIGLTSDSHDIGFILSSNF